MSAGCAGEGEGEKPGLGGPGGSLESIVITPAEVELDEGDFVQLAARGYDEEGSALEELGFSWASSDETVASVDPSGRVQAERGGLAEIRASAHGQVGVAIVTVRFDCPANRADCNQEPSDGCETELLTDGQNCGACGVACGQGEVCSLGGCERRCADGLTACGAACVDLSRSPEHCGDCDTACPEGWSCEESSCVEPLEPCPSGQARCGETCVDLESNPTHCGGCGQGCVEGAHCESGSCACPAGLDLCEDGCRDLSSDPQACGACGKTCLPGQHTVEASCVDGACVATCDPYYDDCAGDGSCGTNLLVGSPPALHCGACDSPCPEGMHCRGGSGRAVRARLRPGSEVRGRLLQPFRGVHRRDLPSHSPERRVESPES